MKSVRNFVFRKVTTDLRDLIGLTLIVLNQLLIAVAIEQYLEGLILLINHILTRSLPQTLRGIIIFNRQVLDPVLVELHIFLSYSKKKIAAVSSENFIIYEPVSRWSCFFSRFLKKMGRNSQPNIQGGQLQAQQNINL